MTAIPRDCLVTMHGVLEEIWAQTVDAQQRHHARNVRARPQRYLAIEQVGDLVLVGQPVSSS